MLLFTPGPTPVPESIRQAMAKPTLHHRTPEFEAIFANTRDKLKQLINMQEVLLLASSGTGAMEACLLSLTRQKTLVINSGKFGERFTKIAKAFSVPYMEITNEWDTPASVESVLQAIKADARIDSVCMQACESSGGLRHPFENIAKAIKAHNPHIAVIVDAITAMGVEAIDTSHIDALIGGSQKAFMLPPAMSIIGLSMYAIETINKRDVGFYFNLKSELQNQSHNTTAYTAPTTIIAGLETYFKLIDNEGGISSVYANTKARSLATQEALQSLGLKIYPKHPAIAMNTIYSPEYATSIRSMLKSTYNVNVAGGQDKLKQSIFRINQMGLIALNEITWVINAIELCLDNLHIREFDGTANRIFLQTYYKLLG